jgi:hypothetical protein
MNRTELLIYAGAADGIADRKGRGRYLKTIGIFVRFCQANGLMWRILLRDSQRATRSTCVYRSDLTDEGYKFFKAAYSKWDKAIHRGRLEPNDTDFLAKTLAWIRGGRSQAPLQLTTRNAPKSKMTNRSKSRRPPKGASDDDARTRASDFELTADEAAEYEAADPHVYDKADWHTEGDFPDDLPDDQANVHTGMFVGWLIDHDMILEEFWAAAERFKRKKSTGAQVYETWGGGLLSDMLTYEGNEFAREYYEGAFADDYRELLVRDLPSFYHVADTWENYKIMKQRIEGRFQAWKKKQRRRVR